MCWTFIRVSGCLINMKLDQGSFSYSSFLSFILQQLKQDVIEDPEDPSSVLVSCNILKICILEQIC